MRATPHSLYWALIRVELEAIRQHLANARRAQQETGPDVVDVMGTQLRRASKRWDGLGTRIFDTSARHHAVVLSWLFSRSESTLASRAAHAREGCALGFIAAEAHMVVDEIIGRLVVVEADELADGGRVMGPPSPALG